MVRIERALPAHAEILTGIQQRAFDAEFALAGVDRSVAPGGYDSVDWQRQMIDETNYYSIFDQETIIGGMIVVKLAEDHYKLMRIFVEPSQQGQGFGAAALAFIESAYPDAVTWELNTPDWAVRNQRFYEKCGYSKVAEAALEDMPLTLIYYEKTLK